MKLKLLLVVLTAGVALGEPNRSSRLDVLREQHRKELRLAIRPAIESHTERLKKLKEQLLAEEKREEALELEVEISRLADLLAAPEILEALEGTWKFTTTKNVFHIGIDGTVYGGKRRARLQIVDSEQRVVRISEHLWILSRDGRALSGKGLEEGSPHPARKL